MVNMEQKMRKIVAILNDLGFEEGVGWTWLYPCVYSKSIKMGIVTAKYTIEVENFVSVIHLNIFGLDYKATVNTDNLINNNGVVEHMLKLLVMSEKTRTRIYDNFVGEINDLK